LLERWSQDCMVYVRSVAGQYNDTPADLGFETLETVTVYDDRAGALYAKRV